MERQKVIDEKLKLWMEHKELEAKVGLGGK